MSVQLHPAAVIALNKAHFPVTVLGPGRRIGLWVQGCSIGYKGCVSMDTWPTDPGRNVPIDALLHWCQSASGGVLDGITLSGGEPFDQPQALLSLLHALHRWRDTLAQPFDILCYSGSPLKALRQHHAKVLTFLDAVMAEPFVERLATPSAWRGSSNQQLVALTPLGQARYEHALAQEPASKQMQLAVEGGKVWMIGIPERGDMARLEALCQSRGLSLDQVSWRR